MKEKQARNVTSNIQGVYNKDNTYVIKIMTGYFEKHMTYHYYFSGYGNFDDEDIGTLVSSEFTDFKVTEIYSRQVYGMGEWTSDFTVNFDTNEIEGFINAKVTLKSKYGSFDYYLSRKSTEYYYFSAYFEDGRAFDAFTGGSTRCEEGTDVTVTIEFIS